MSNETNHQELALSFSNLMRSVKKNVKIEIAVPDFEIFKRADYRLCFAKKVGDNFYNVVWQSYREYLINNTFSWLPQYSLFCSNYFRDYDIVRAVTNEVHIGLGETSRLNQDGMLGAPWASGPTNGFCMDNRYGSIHPCVKQVSIGINGRMESTPVYVTIEPVVPGVIVLTPVEKIMIWFEQNVDPGTMFSTAKSLSVEIDFSSRNDASLKYENQQWIET